MATVHAQRRSERSPATYTRKKLNFGYTRAQVNFVGNNQNDAQNVLHDKERTEHPAQLIQYEQCKTLNSL